MTLGWVAKLERIFPRNLVFPGGVAMPYRCSLIGIFALLGAVVIGGGALPEIPFGTVTAVAGAATVTRRGRVMPVRYGESVQAGDRIATGADARVTVTLSDKSQLQLTESSTLDLTENTLNADGSRAETKVSLLGGLVRSRIHSTSGGPANFEIRTPNAVARGTTYDTEYRKGATRQGYADCREFTDVVVYNGTATVSNPGSHAQPVQVRADQRTVVPCYLPAASATASSGATTGMSASAIAAIGALGVAGIGGGVAAAIAASSSSGGSGSTSRSAASSSQ